MPRLSDPYDERIHGRLVLTHILPDLVDVFYVPPANRVGKLVEAENRPRAKLLQVDTQKNWLTIFPIHTNQSVLHDLFEPKYENIKSIKIDLNTNWRISLPTTPEEIMEILEELPSTFIKDYDFGLGIARMYNPVVRAVQELSNCTEIAILYNQATGISKNGKIFYINREDYENLSKNLKNVRRLASTASLEVRKVISHNLFADKIGLPQIPVGTGRHPLRKLFTAVAQGEEYHLSDEEKESFLRVMSKNAKPLAREKSKSLLDLQDNILVANLEVFNSRFEQLLAESNQSESFWQQFFNDYPFILSLAVGCPVIIVQGQAFVGGTAFAGDGGRITDFLAKNSKTRNVSIIEIKKPQTKLLGKYRKVANRPSNELAGAIMQILDQKSSLEKSFQPLKANTGSEDVELHSVQCCLIIGSIPADPKEQRSFELIRQNSKNVNIVTFDELLENLKQLQNFLTNYKKDDNRKDVQQ